MALMASVAALALAVNVAVGLKRTVQEDPRWNKVIEILDQEPSKCINGTCYMTDFAFTVGGPEGRVFQHQVGTKISVETNLAMASASKMPSAVAILGAVVEDTVDLDEPVSTYLSFWTKDPTDKRSKITLRHLLSFTSGLYSADAGGFTSCMLNATYDFIDCAEQIYNEAPFEFEPGTTFDYNSYHLQIAGAVACVASNKTIKELLEENLILKLGLKNTTYTNIEHNPLLAGGLRINGNDYEIFLKSYLNHEILPKSITDQVEYDYTDPAKGIKFSNSSAMLVDYIGHYGFAHYIECWFNGNGTFTPACKAQHVHSDPGLFGYYPLIDRRYNYYMQIVFMYIVTSAADFGPTQSSALLRIAVKPCIDKIMNGSSLEC